MRRAPLLLLRPSFDADSIVAPSSHPRRGGYSALRNVEQRQSVARDLPITALRAGASLPRHPAPAGELQRTLTQPKLSGEPPCYPSMRPWRCRLENLAGKVVRAAREVVD
jgi:hypothetical protein